MKLYPNLRCFFLSSDLASQCTLFTQRCDSNSTKGNQPLLDEVLSYPMYILLMEICVKYREEMAIWVSYNVSVMDITKCDSWPPLMVT